MAKLQAPVSGSNSFSSCRKDAGNRGLQCVPWVHPSTTFSNSLHTPSPLPRAPLQALHGVSPSLPPQAIKLIKQPPAAAKTGALRARPTITLSNPLQQATKRSHEHMSITVRAKRKRRESRTQRKTQRNLKKKKKVSRETAIVSGLKAAVNLDSKKDVMLIFVLVF